MPKTIQQLGREVGVAAVECADAAANFCFTRLHAPLLREVLEEKAAIYVDKVDNYKAGLLDAEQETQSQELRDKEGSVGVPEDSSDKP